MANRMLNRIVDGRTDLVFDLLAAGNAATAICFLLANGAPLQSLGDNLDLNGAAVHGHLRLPTDSRT